MIDFACASCGLKLKVKEEFAGRSTRCPTCKQPLTVPAPDRTQATVPEGPLDGALSSLARQSVEAGVTLPPAGGAARPAQQSVHELLARRTKDQGRYVIEDELARGGMGVVMRAIDCDIRREVAVKFLLDQVDLRKKARFIEEAQITGQLEHPNIVPIHELGADGQQRLFFAMKMVRGCSLAQVLDRLRQEPHSAEREYTLSRLLSVFVNVCNALAYAHVRDVVHRDLKPANIMLGDFGEVYVMDWGLAKVLTHKGTAPSGAPPTQGANRAAAASDITARTTSRVATSREPNADLTQDGAILGTLVYMPPEQAQGHVSAIDTRSDIYALGAILYELLTLQPPVENDGDYLAILIRVAEGNIKPPEERTPQRARAGRIPRELSAVAMKALARDPADRYASVEALRHDIERFQEGRAVSAKDDTAWETCLKLVKRNKGASAATLLSLLVLAVVLGISFKVIYGAKVEAQEALQSYREVQDAKREQARKSVPAFVAAARLLVDRKEFPAALSQINVALDYDPDYAEARLLKGQLLASRREFAAAAEELKLYGQSRPQDRDAARLAELCRPGHAEDLTRIVAVVEVLLRQGQYVLAENLVESREQLLAVYRQRIEAAWPGLGAWRFSKAANGPLRLTLTNHKEISSLRALRGMPINSLDLGNTSVLDLTPLQGMPLSSLNLWGCPEVSDLTPLRGLKLSWLSLYHCARVKDLAPLQGMPLTWLDLGRCPIRDLRPLEGMPLTHLNLEGCPVQDLTPLRDMKLTWLNLHDCRSVRDLKPLQGMPLTYLSILACGQIQDLRALEGMPLTHLTLRFAGGVKDLTPLASLKLNYLDLNNCSGIKDLMPLRDMPLETLSLYGCPQVKDLTPLANLKLRNIGFHPWHITQGLDVLRRMDSLKTINEQPAVEFWKKRDAEQSKK